MSIPSGQINFYKFTLNNRLDSSPVVHVCIQTDRSRVSENYITLGIRAALTGKASLDPVNTYVNERLQHLGAYLHTWSMPSFSDEVLAGRTNTGDIAPSHIKVSNYLNARRVIDDLFTHNEMSGSDRADMENALRELEKSGGFANKRVDSITIAQKDVIQSFVSPYIDDIKSEAPDAQTARRWIECTAAALNTFSSNTVKNSLSSFLGTAGLSSGCGKSESFYECLFTISKIYTNIGDLEGALEQLGESLPSNSIIQQTILDLFN